MRKIILKSLEVVAYNEYLYSHSHTYFALRLVMYRQFIRPQQYITDCGNYRLFSSVSQPRFISVKRHGNRFLDGGARERKADRKGECQQVRPRGASSKSAEASHANESGCGEASSQFYYCHRTFFACFLFGLMLKLQLRKPILIEFHG